MSHPATDFKSGYVAIVGSPNVGKSTLLNRFLQQKIAIVSPRPQTTRNRILGIVTEPGYQLVFVDTPGMHQPRTPLGQSMVKAAMDALAEVDVILAVVEPASAALDKTRIIAVLRDIATPVILVVNKVDSVKKETVLPVLAQYRDLYSFRAFVPISALTGEGVDRLLSEILSLVPYGMPYYPPDMVTDQPERFIAGELIREKIFLLTGQEVPYSTAAVVDEFKEDAAKGIISISATIYVEKESQKRIIIGKGGSLLKRIGESARKDMEAALENKVFLRLWVKVRKDWTKSPGILRQLGY